MLETEEEEVEGEKRWASVEFIDEEIKTVSAGIEEARNRIKIELSPRSSVRQ